MGPGRSLLDMGWLLMDLQDLLGCEPQIAEPEGIHFIFAKEFLKKPCLCEG
ncbi:MAG TPA: hypothetical protein PLQ49_06460 [Methanothrix sp.]|nr:hypothetical protein [Methanothrix sp.]HRW82175.1 hypothetical protein [Methanothrix sp.]